MLNEQVFSLLYEPLLREGAMYCLREANVAREGNVERIITSA